MAKGGKELIVQENSDIVDQMSPELRKVYDRIRDRLVKVAQNDVMARYDVGTMILAVMANESKYGARAAEQLAKALDITKAVLYLHTKVASSWTREDLQATIARVDSVTGYHLAWWHVLILAGVEDTSKRAELIDECLQDKMSGRQIKARVDDVLGFPDNNGKSRTITMPHSPSAGLASLRKLTNSLVNAQAMFEETIFVKIADSPEDYSSDSIVEKLREAEEDQTRLELTAKNNRLRLHAALETIERSKRSKSDIEEAAESVGESVGDEFLPRRKNSVVVSKQVSPSTSLAKDSASIVARAKLKLKKSSKPVVA